MRFVIFCIITAFVTCQASTFVLRVPEEEGEFVLSEEFLEHTIATDTDQRYHRRILDSYAYGQPEYSSKGALQRKN